MPEAWRDIPGLDGYQASADGRVRSLTRKVRCKNGWRSSTGRVLVPWLAKSTGYLQVNASSKRQSVHRLIALAWCPGYFDGAHVNHKNGVRDDNRAENLEWVTPSENIRHSFASERTSPFLGKFSSEHPTSKGVISTCLTTGAVTRYASAMDAVRDGFRSDGISRCCQGKIRFHKGKVWRFANDQERAA